jgi:CBS domain-containing protein
MAFGLEILPVIPGIKKYLGLPSYSSLREVSGPVDIVQVYLSEGVDLAQTVRDAVRIRARALWIEEGTASPEVRELLARDGVQLIEHESLEREYGKHFPFIFSGTTVAERVSIKIAERMTKNPVTVKPRDAIKDAIEKMKHGRFRHLPVVDDDGKLIGMISDRDIRLIRPSLAFVSSEEAAAQLWSTAVRQAAVFNPVTIQPDAPLEQAAELMLRWEIGGLPVVDGGGKLVGIITYTDLLRELIARGKQG